MPIITQISLLNLIRRAQKIQCYGKISGKHGTAVAVIMKNGTTYLREYVKPSNPRTDKQQAHRAKFALSSKALVPFNPIFKETIGITNGISIARSHAFNNAIVGEYPSFSVDYENLMFSFGTLEKLQSTSFAINEGVMTIKWSFNKMYNCHSDDSVNLVLFNKDTNQAIHIKDVASRLDKEVKIDIPEVWHEADLYMWAYVTHGDEISDSVFVDKYVPVGIEPCAYPEEEKNIDMLIFGGVYQSVMAFLIMVCNWIGLFREVPHCRGVALSYTHNVKTLLCTVVRELEFKFSRYTNPMLIPIMIPNGKYRLNNGYKTGYITNIV